MRVLLIDPALDCPELEPPLGLLYLASALRKSGVSCDVTDLNFDSDLARLGGILNNTRYDVIGVSVISYRLSDVTAVLRFLPHHAPRSPVVLGGPHITGVGVQGLENSPADYLVFGEGEETLLELIRALTRNPSSQIHGLAGTLCRVAEGEKVDWKKNSPRPVKACLDDYGYPDRGCLTHSFVIWRFQQAV